MFPRKIPGVRYSYIGNIYVCYISNLIGIDGQRMVLFTLVSYLELLCFVD